MRPYRQIKRDYRKPFFSRRRSSWAGMPLALTVIALALAVAGLFGIALGFSDELAMSINEFMGTPRPTATLPANEYAVQGIERYHAGELEAAGQLLALAAEQRPRDIAYLYEYGKVLIELDRYDEAVALGDQAIAAAPNDERGYALKARALMWSDPGAAIPLAVSGLEHNPDFAPLHAVLAISYNQIGRYAEALQRGLRATELDPLDAFAHRAFSYPLINTGRYDQAIGALEQAVMINPNLTAPYFELAGVYSLRDFEEMAVGIYRRILELEPDSAKAYLRICQTYAEVGEFQAGTESVKSRPISTRNMRQLGKCWGSCSTTGVTTRARSSRWRLAWRWVRRRWNATTSAAWPTSSWAIAAGLGYLAGGLPLYAGAKPHGHHQHRLAGYPRELPRLR